MKKIKYAIAFIFVFGLTWYLFIKPHDYIIRFKAKTSPGTLFRGAEDWNLLNQKMNSFTYVIHHKNPYTDFDETMETDEMSLDLNWNFKSINDSLTQVSVGLSEKENSIYNRLSAPFLNTYFKKKVINLIEDYKSGIEYQLKEKFNVTYVGIDFIPEQNYAYIKFENINMLDKATKMIDYNTFFLKFLNNHNIKNGDFPFLIIDKWNIIENTIDFRYCFPIKVNDTLPYDSSIKFDKLPSKKALKAIYNGNFMTSDRGWFELHEYAKRNDISIENKPIEFFRNNPFDGGVELNWVTEVYMPVK